MTELILRVLYRCTTLAELAPFNAPTLSYIMPLLSSVIKREKSSQDNSQEQLILTLNLIRLHIPKGSADTQTSCSLFILSLATDVAYPRIEMMRNIGYILSHHFTLAKDSASALIQLGEVIHANASREEVDFLLQSTCVEEAHARNAILQALQVRL